MVRRIRITGTTVRLAGLVYAEPGHTAPCAVEIEASDDACVGTEDAPSPSFSADDEDDLDLPFTSEPAALSSLQDEALSAVWAAIHAAMFDGEIADMTRSGALADARAGIDRAIISALDARSGRLSRPALTALAVQIDNAARKISALAGQIGALNTDTRDAQAHARTAAEALAALTAEMARIDAATRTNGAPSKGWRIDLEARLTAILSVDDDLLDRISDAACAAVDAIDLRRAETIAEARKNLREKS